MKKKKNFFFFDLIEYNFKFCFCCYGNHSFSFRTIIWYIDIVCLKQYIYYDLMKTIFLVYFMFVCFFFLDKFYLHLNTFSVCSNFVCCIWCYVVFILDFKFYINFISITIGNWFSADKIHWFVVVLFVTKKNSSQAKP